MTVVGECGFPPAGISAAMWAWMSLVLDHIARHNAIHAEHPPSWRCLSPCWPRCQVSGYSHLGLRILAAVYAASLWLFGMNRYERGIVTGVLDKFRRKRAEKEHIVQT